MFDPRPYWIDAPSVGRIAVMRRPHPEAFGALKALGVDVVVSLLEPDEALPLGLADEAGLAQAAGIEFLWLPVADHGVPPRVEPVEAMSAEISRRLKQGKGVAVHCFAGLGRSPLLIAAVMIDAGIDAYKACELISSARGHGVPEMGSQVEWLLDYELRKR